MCVLHFQNLVSLSTALLGSASKSQCASGWHVCLDVMTSDLMWEQGTRLPADLDLCFESIESQGTSWGQEFSSSASRVLPPVITLRKDPMSKNTLQVMLAAPSLERRGKKDLCLPALH